MSVIFIHTFYYPAPEELARLQALQNVLNGAHVEIEQMNKNLSPGEKYLSKQRYYKGFRSRWLIYQGLMEKNTSSAF